MDPTLPVQPPGSAADTPLPITDPEDTIDYDQIVTEYDSPVDITDPEDTIDYDQIVTEDDTPVDNLFSEKQARLLTEPLYSSWAGPGEGRPFLALADVGLYFAVKRPPLVPDVMLSLDVQAAEDIWQKRNRSYFVWVFGKVPEVVIEIVSNREGGEDSDKLRDYARCGVPWYVIYDPANQLGGGVLRGYGLNQGSYEPVEMNWLPAVGLGLTLWQGTFEDMPSVWLRWCDQDGQVVPTGKERAGQEKLRAESAEQRAGQEKLRAEQEKLRAESAEQRAEQLAERLRTLGIEP